MKPRESIRFFLQFGGPWTPWWLVLALPVVVLLGWYLYRNQFKAIARVHVLALLALRLGLLAALVFILFRPSLVYRKIVTYPGRIVLLLDDSESMLTRDSGMPVEEALRISRSLGPESSGPGGPRVAYDQLAKTISHVADLIQDFQQISQGADRRKDAFWNEAAGAKGKVMEQFEQFDRTASIAPPVGNEERFAAVRQEARELRGSIDTFFTGSQDPGPKAYDDFLRQASSLIRELLELQAAVDRSKAGDPALIAAADSVRSRTRLDLLSQKLANASDTVTALTPGQFVQVEHLMTRKKEEFSKAAIADLHAVHGRTDLVGRLGEIVAEENDFPLSGIVLFSDGRDLGGHSGEVFAQEASRRQVPVCTAGVGSVREPVDLAILRVIAPPFAVKGSPVRVKLDLKTSLPAPADLKVSILKGAQTVAEEKFTLGKEATQTVAMEFTPSETGLFRYTAQMEVLPGEAFADNNAADFALDVRDHKLWVLFVDWKPRWETRFALNILQRLDYVELNSIIGIVHDGGVIPRGVQKGAWPDKPEALQVYDLIVLGDLPPGFLSAAEWDALKTTVVQGGKTLCFLGPGGHDPVPGGNGLAEALLPLESQKVAAPIPLQDMDQLRLTDAGEIHPLTRGMEGAVMTGTENPAGLPSDAQVLLFNNATGAPLISSRFTGKGKTVLIDTDDLWKLLNPAHLDAHTDLYVGLVSWAMQGGFNFDAAGAKGPALDLRSYTSEQSMQVWSEGKSKGARMSMNAGDKAVAEALCAPLREGSAIGRTVFRNPPPKDANFRDADSGATSQSVVVVEDYPELKFLARDEPFLENMAVATGGVSADFTNFERCLRRIKPKERVETFESVWRLWSSALVLTLMAVMLTAEWVWRKFVRLV